MLADQPRAGKPIKIEGNQRAQLTALACCESLEGPQGRYALPYDPKYPGVCFDERPCFLIGDRVAPMAMHTGKVRKEH